METRITSNSQDLPVSTVLSLKDLCLTPGFENVSCIQQIFFLDLANKLKICLEIT